MPIKLLQVLLLGLIGTTAVHQARGEAQVSAFPELDLPTLGQRAEEAFPGNPEAGIPYMIEIRGRLTGAMSEEFRAIYRENLYMLGLAHINWYQQTGNPAHLAAGIPYWDEFIEDFVSDERHRLALLNRADSYFGSEQWGDALKGYHHALSVYRFQLSEADLLGAVRGLLAAADRTDQGESIVDLLGELTAVEFSDEVRLLCLNALFDRALASNQLEELLELVSLINQDRRFRYDLGINLRLLSVGDRFEEEERFLEAGLLFSMVLPLEQLLFAVEDRLIEIEEQLFTRAYIASKGPVLEAQLADLREKRAELLAAPRYTANLRWRQARVLRLMGRTFEAFFAFRRLIERYPQHEHNEQFRYAAFLQGLECGYQQEAVAIAEAYLSEPAFVLFEKPVAVQLARIYEARQSIEKLSRLADEFLHRFPYEPVAAQMAHSLGQALFKKGDTGEILETFPFWAEEFPDGAFIDSVHYWSGMAYLFVGDFAQALDKFDRLITTNPGSVYFTEARFRRGVALFGMGDYEAARELFTAWVAEHEGHPLSAEAQVFLGDLDAMDAEVESALAHYAKVEALGGTQALIDHAYFESSALLLANQRFDANAALLERYLERFPESPAGSEAVLLLAESDMVQGDYASAFARFRAGVERFGDSVEADHVDHLIDAWWEADADLRARIAQTRACIEKLLTDEHFRSTMLYDRVSQIQYFQAHPAIPESLRQGLNPRETLYEELAKKTAREVSPGKRRELSPEDFPRIQSILNDLEAIASQLPDTRPAATFAAMRTKALDAGRKALALRLLRALNLRSVIEVSPVELGEAEIDHASPATLVWIAAIRSDSDPLGARMLLEQAIEQAPVGSTAAEALFLLAELEMEAAFFDQAADYYAQILENYFNHERASHAALRRGDALRLARRYEDAIEAYSLVINQRNWRGEIWAEATFKIGLCFLQREEQGKAQGFFERTYLAYAGYPKWAGKAVVESARLLEARGDLDSARRTYEHFLATRNATESPLYEEIRQRLEAL